jgi:hypothetical protein
MILRLIVRLGIVALAAGAALVPLPPGAIERWYSQGLYPAIQEQFTPATNQIPIALLDVAILAAIVFAAWRFARLRSGGFVRSIVSGAAGLATSAALLYLVFMTLWGFNYRRVPLRDKIVHEPASVTDGAARQFAGDAVAGLNALHGDAHHDSPAGPTLEQAFASAQTRLGAKTTAVPGIPKRSVLEVYFRWAAIDGMTNPFFHEIIVNPDVLPTERPFVIAHEWAHLAGYAVESEASLLAWLTCRHGNALAQYSGWMAMFGQVQAQLPPREQRDLFARLEPGPRKDFAAIAARFARSQPMVRNVARDTYDVFLRANRVEAGISSYDEVVQLILGGGAEHGWTPRLR